VKLTRAAKRMLNGSHLTEERVVELAREGLVQPSDSYFRDEDVFVTHTLMFHTPAWSITHDDPKGETIYRMAKDQLSRYGRSVTEESVGHWTYSRFSCLKVRVLTDAGNITTAFVHALIIATDEDGMWGEYYHEVEEEIWDEAFDYVFTAVDRERMLDDEPDLSDEEKAAYREYFHETYGGHSEPGYIRDEWHEDCLERALHPIPRQELTLF
jgi:hypothetical protein